MRPIILLVGGAGFIGHHLALALKADGYQVHVVDGLSVNNVLYMLQSVRANKRYLGYLEERLELLEAAEIPLYVKDVRDYHEMSRLADHIRPEIIIHLAAVAHANRANKDPYSTFDHSLRTLENMLDIAVCKNLAGRVKRFVYFSSSMVYGNFMEKEVTEESPLNPIGIYGSLKVSGELMVRAYHQVFGLPYTIIRPSGLYGERCVSGRVMQKFVEAAMEGKPIVIDGDGEEMIDFTFIRDLVAGTMLAIKKKKGMNQIFNITYGRGRSLNDLAKIVAGSISASVIHCQRDNLIPYRGTLSIGKAKKLLGYDPTWPLEKGIAEYILWNSWRREK